MRPLMACAGMAPFSARLWKPPPAMAVTPLRYPTPSVPSTCTGVLLSVNVPLPNCPAKLYPQAQTVPSLFSARLRKLPLAMAVTPLRYPAPTAPSTWTGVLLLVNVPLPNCPKKLSPQAQTVPSLCSARVLLSLAPAIAVTPLSPLTCTGVLLLVNVPLPNCPASFHPQAQTVPSLFSARLCSMPPAIAVTPLSPLTSTGVLLVVFVPLPNCPAKLAPQAQAVPWACADWHKQNNAIMEHAIVRRRCIVVLL